MATDHDGSLVRPASDWREEYLRRYYSGRTGDEWPNIVRRHLLQDVRVLEIGGGPVEWTTGMLRERAAEVVGIDIDPLVRGNRLLDEAVVYDGGIFPFPDGRFDLPFLDGSTSICRIQTFTSMRSHVCLRPEAFTSSAL